MRNIISKLFFTLLLLAMSIGNVWGDEVTVGFTTGLGAKNATTSTRTIVDVDHITITHILNSGTSGALAVYNKSDKDLYYGSTTKTYCYNEYKWNVNTSNTFNNNYVGFQVDVEDGYKLSLSELEVTLAVSANFVCKVEIVDDEANVLYTSDSWTIANNGKNGTNGINPTFTEVGNPDLQDLTGTFYVRTQLAFNSTGKYLCFPIFTITGELETAGSTCSLSGPSVTGGGIYHVGDEISLTANVTGTPTSYTWKNSANTTVGTTNPLVINPCDYSDADTYTCFMSDGSCEKSASANVVVKMACPTSGSLFSMEITDPDGTEYTDVTLTEMQEIGASYTGGKAYAGSTSTSKRTPVITGNEFDFDVSSGGSVVVKIELDCDLAEGDIISLTSSADKEFKIQKTATDGLYTTSGKSFTIPESSPLIGEDVIYILRNNSACKFSEINITRPLYRTITLEYADGATADGSLEVIDGNAAVKPADPTWEHHRFDGWYNGASPYDWSATVSGDLTLTAHWTQLYTVTYAAGDGTATGDAPTQVDKAAGETFEVAANTFAVAGKDFDKWNDGSADYSPGDTYTVGTANVVLTAQWKTAADKYTVIFKDGETTLDTKLVEVGSNPSDAGVDKTKALSTFAAWQKEGVDIALDDAFWATVVKDATVTLTARWSVVYALDVNFKDGETQALGVETVLNTYHYASDASDISFESKGLKIKTDAARFYFNVAPGKVAEIKFGNISGATYSVDGGAAETLSTSQQKATYSASAQSCVMTMTTGAYNIVEKVVIHDPYTVTFNANGGDDVASLQGKPTVNLPSATNGTESFMGWYLAADGDDKVGDAGDEYTPTANIELFAHWEAISTDARLASITLDPNTGVLEPAFDPEVVNYTYTMPYPTAAVPTITGATAVNANAQAPVIDAQAAAWNATAIIRGVAQSGDSKAYNITMKLAPKDGISIIKVASTGGTNKTVTGLYAGDGHVNLSTGSKAGKMDDGKFIGFMLDGTTLQAGDQINVHTTAAATTGGSHIIFFDNMTDKNELYETGEMGGVGDNIFTINAAMVGQTTAYVYRENSDYAHQWNGFVDFIEVLRPMNPILKKVTVNGVEGAPVGTTVTIEVPFTTSQSQLEAITYDWISNNDAWTADPANAPVATNAWEFGVANTVTLTDKDGDASVYTITVNKAVASTNVELAALTVNGNAIAVVPGQAVYSYELPYGTTDAPTVAVTAEDANAEVGVITQAASATGSATFTVTAEDGTTYRDYTINFSVCRGQTLTIYDGSSMDAILETGSIAPGLEWTIKDPNTLAATSANGTFEGKTYTKEVNLFTSATKGEGEGDTRYMTITIPNNYLAKFRLVGTSNSNSGERSLFISKTKTGVLDQSIAYATSETYSTLAGMTSAYQLPGTYYLCATKSIRLYELSVTLYPIDYSRTTTEGRYGTICLPKAGVMVGAELYEVAYYGATSQKIFLDQIPSGEMVAGRPYIFLPNEGASQLGVFYTDAVNADAGSHNGLIGSYTKEPIAANAGNYILLNNQYCPVESTVDPVYVGANKAYIKLSEITPTEPALKPGAKRVGLGVAAPQTPTDVDNLNATDAPVKVMINGQMYILRGEKMYNANGQLVK